MEKVAFETLGCKVNQYETQAMADIFKKAGYDIVDFESYADIYVINTCTVTSFGDKKSRQMIRKAKKLNDKAIIAVAGCYSQVSPDEVLKIPGVNIVLGTNDRNKIAELIDEYKIRRSPIKHVVNIMNVREFEELEIDEYRDKTRAFLKIQDGCNRFCSYCLIPYARGPIRSREPQKVIEQVNRLSKSGFKEIILSGIHVASYGKDLKDINLTDLIEKIQHIDGIERIRIGSVEPTFFTGEVIKRFNDMDKLCRHFHLSLQSGCDETLKRMNRHYTTDEYKKIVYDLREAFSDVSITTDVIVGFPGESQEEFEKTFNFLKDIELSKMHIFKYSPREGTPAAKFKEQISPEIKEKRSDILLKLNSINERKFIDKFIGRKLEVLFEQNVKNMEGYLEGYTHNYINVKANGNNSIIGDIKQARLIKNEGQYAAGEILL
ncbi:threonylcarbamoyladenosine tRNA methylthiotransferase MtaB [Oxobacter pfennigii]|uniref:Threonylcarbamoyladenosine tRNA methylthiotransferase MtaB n=1 Tax=Oxobacter pfennigii TaxID=36849 RepID=A0A0P8YAS4_9CLOT|nr:tRNA (N(6)-L-threonylcarbamoyladenosine(37)-C(2))-methylthiotransferase MtaB [Oxobacter pfennigii]KPU44121.1 threonylcarbamoyladenosine tRNA methylthiotransferase MtaB [Oxobacter pfennigii]